LREKDEAEEETVYHLSSMVREAQARHKEAVN
jgi:hypothetical protein